MRAGVAGGLGRARSIGNVYVPRRTPPPLRACVPTAGTSKQDLISRNHHSPCGVHTGQARHSGRQYKEHICTGCHVATTQGAASCVPASVRRLDVPVVRYSTRLARPHLFTHPFGRCRRDKSGSRRRRHPSGCVARHESDFGRCVQRRPRFLTLTSTLLRPSVFML